MKPKPLTNIFIYHTKKKKKKAFTQPKKNDMGCDVTVNVLIVEKNDAP